MTISKAEVRSRFVAQIDAMVSSSKATAAAFLNGEQRPPHGIDKGEWDGDPTDLAGIALAFSRAEHADDVGTVTTDGGVVGDLAASAIQGDLLACLERSYRQRSMSRVRRSLHAAARRAGQGSDAGVLRRGVQGMVEGVLKQSKDVVV